MRLKAYWTVKAGVIPDQAIHYKRFEYTNQDFEEDQREHTLVYHAKFAQIRALAMDYFLQMNNPAAMNWATIEYVWV